MHTNPMIETKLPPSRRRDAPRTAHGELRLTSFGVTDRGLCRHTNEDAFLVLPLPAAGVPGDAAQLLVVADGVGGANGGGVASALTVETLEGRSPAALGPVCEARPPRPGRVFEQLRALFRRADARLAEEVAQHPDLKGMATTLTVALALGRTLYVAHAGDSRCYLLHGTALRQLTADQTVARQLALDGLIPLENVDDHPFRHALSNWVGIGEKLAVEVHEATLAPGDAVLLCSDGLTEMVPPLEIAAILRAAPTPEHAARALVARANTRGGHDNVTAVVAHASLAP